MKPYQRHIVVCNGKDCKKRGGGKKLLKHAGKCLGSDGRFIKRSHVKCLGTCKHGPMLLVYPDGTWYGRVDEERVEQIMEAYIRGGRPVQECVKHQMSTPDVETT